MQQTLNIALVQADLFWEDPEKNRLYFTKIIDDLDSTVDVVVLPEMFTSGFTMQAKAVAETMQGNTVSWMLALASKTNIAIAGSVVIFENNNYYNRFLFVEPSGKTTYYNKRHTFTLAGEHNVYTAGKTKVIIAYKGWKICPLICYDLRFPVWSRNVEYYDVLLYVANWPVNRIDAWDSLLKARAIENMSYCIGVNRVGVDGLGMAYCGSSSAYDVLGKKITEIPLNKAIHHVVTLHKTHIEKYRRTLRFLEDKDAFNLLK